MRIFYKLIHAVLLILLITSCGEVGDSAKELQDSITHADSMGQIKYTLDSVYMSDSLAGIRERFKSRYKKVIDSVIIVMGNLEEMKDLATTRTQMLKLFYSDSSNEYLEANLKYDAFKASYNSYLLMLITATRTRNPEYKVALYKPVSERIKRSHDALLAYIADAIDKRPKTRTTYHPTFDDENMLGGDPPSETDIFSPKMIEEAKTPPVLLINTVIVATTNAIEMIKHYRDENREALVRILQSMEARPFDLL